MYMHVHSEVGHLHIVSCPVGSGNVRLSLYSCNEKNVTMMFIQYCKENGEGTQTLLQYNDMDLTS